MRTLELVIRGKEEEYSLHNESQKGLFTHEINVRKSLNI